MPEEAAMQSVAPDPLRIVLFVREPGGTLYQRIQDVLRQSGHRVVGVLTSAGPRARRTDRYLEVVAQTPLSADVFVSNFPERWAGMLAPLRPDLIMIFGFSWKAPDDVLALPRIGTINWHGALLPKYRGRGDWALQWMFRNDEAHYGVTYHWVDSGFDTGPILGQAVIPITDADDASSLFAQAVEQAIVLLPTVLEKAARRDPGIPQGDGGFYCAPLEPEWRIIDWTAPARAVHNQVRGWLGQGALATVDGARLRIIKTRVVPATANADVSAAPGTVLERGVGTITVQCGDGPLTLVEWSVEEDLS
jgi:methionyl-tRNA formyltransferase